MSQRIDARKSDEIRPIQIISRYLPNAEGSVLITAGNTQILCAVSIEERVPPFLSGSGKGWITAEYGMLPRSTHTRMPRQARNDRGLGRTMEIQRLIGRSLRAIADPSLLGNRTFIIDCDVLQADGGTRTLSITGAYVALYEDIQDLISQNILTTSPLKNAVAGISTGLVNGNSLLDLCYAEDSKADVDFNVVKTDSGELVEIQATAEGQTFTKETMDNLLSLADVGLKDLFKAQQQALQSF